MIHKQPPEPLLFQHPIQVPPTPKQTFQLRGPSCRSHFYDMPSRKMGSYFFDNFYRIFSLNARSIAATSARLAFLPALSVN